MFWTRINDINGKESYNVGPTVSKSNIIKEICLQLMRNGGARNFEKQSLLY